jgi:hypothetical protein
LAQLTGEEGDLTKIRAKRTKLPDFRQISHRRKRHCTFDFGSRAMRSFQFLIAILALLALAACGGGGGSGGIGGGGVGGALGFASVYRTAQGDLIEQSVALDESLRGLPGHSTAHGASGVMATATTLDATPDLRGFRVRLSSDRTTAIVDIQGLGTFNLAATGLGPSAIGGNYELNGTLQDVDVSLQHALDMGLIGLTDTRNLSSVTFGTGHYGLETPPSELSGVVSYTGNVFASSYVSSLSTDTAAIVGTFDMTIDFGASSISGTTGGSLSHNAGGGAASGSINGSVSGSGISGSFTWAGSGVSAQSTFAGKLFGWTADETGGGVIGTVNGVPVYGNFDGDRF